MGLVGEESGNLRNPAAIYLNNSGKHKQKLCEVRKAMQNKYSRSSATVNKHKDAQLKSNTISIQSYYKENEENNIHKGNRSMSKSHSQIHFRTITY